MRANFDSELSGCCSVGIAYYVDRDDLYHQEEHTQWSTKSGCFIWIGRKNQKADFDKLCKQFKLLSATRTPGRYGIDLAICVFQGAKKLGY